MTITQSRALDCFPWLAVSHPDLAACPLWWTVRIPHNTCFAVDCWTSRHVAEWFAGQAGRGCVVRGFVLGDRGERVYVDELGDSIMQLTLGGESGAEPGVAVRIADE